MDRKEGEWDALMLFGLGSLCLSGTSVGAELWLLGLMGFWSKITLTTASSITVKTTSDTSLATVSFGRTISQLMTTASTPTSNKHHKKHTLLGWCPCANVCVNKFEKVVDKLKSEPIKFLKANVLTVLDSGENWINGNMNCDTVTRESDAS